MIRIIVDAATRDKLANAKIPLELCDDAGQVLGHFLPARDGCPWEGLEPQISDEELDRRERAGGGRTLTEILADLAGKQ